MQFFQRIEAKTKGWKPYNPVWIDNPEQYEALANKLNISDKVIFIGFVPETKDYYAASDIFVFPTLYEPFGLVITEAMASDAPVITSKLADAAELMNDGHGGLLLDNPTDPSNIVEKINLLTEDEKLRKQIGKNARKTIKVYEDILGE